MSRPAKRQKTRAFHINLEEDEEDTVQTRTVITTRRGRVKYTPRATVKGSTLSSAASWDLDLEKDNTEYGLDAVDYMGGDQADDERDRNEIPKAPPIPKIKVKKKKKHWVRTRQFC